jgi:hypothetical protein
METYQIKITGKRSDIVDATILIEHFVGTSDIKRMSGIMPGDKEGHHHRFIEVFSQNNKKLVVDNNGNLLKAFLKKLSFRKQEEI